MSTSDYYEVKIIDHLFRNQAFSPPATVYLSLHTADPADTGASEVAGGSYARQACALTAGSSPAGTSGNSAQIDFATMPSATVTHAGLWDAASAGNFLIGGALTSPKVVNATDTFRVAIGSLVMTIS